MTNRALGGDFSYWCGDTDFVKGKNAGLSFMYTRACWLREDTKFKTFWRDAKGVMPRSAYSYLDWRGSISAQTQLFLDLIKGDIGELPPILDLEMNPAPYSHLLTLGSELTDIMPETRKKIGLTENPYEGSLINKSSSNLALSPSEVQGGVWNWLQAVEKATGKVPWIYCGYYYWKEWMSSNSAWAKYPFILAWYLADENSIRVPAPWKTWTMWQYTSNGDGPHYGTHGLSLDLNWFNGTEQELNAIAGISQPTPVPVPEPQPNPQPQPTPTPVTGQYKVYNAIGSNVDVRLGAFGNSELVGYLDNGTIVNVSGAETSTHYYPITSPLTGYVFTSYVIPVSNPVPTPGPAPVAYTLYKVKPLHAPRIRKEANVNSDALGVIPQLTVLHIDKPNPVNGYIHFIDYVAPNMPTSGWVFGDYLTRV